MLGFLFFKKSFTNLDRTFLCWLHGLFCSLRLHRMAKGSWCRRGTSRLGAQSAGAVPLTAESPPSVWGTEGGGGSISNSSSGEGGGGGAGRWSQSCHLPMAVGDWRRLGGWARRTARRTGEAGEAGQGGQPHFLCFSSLSLLLALLSVWLLGLLLRYILSMALRASVR